MRSSMEVSDSIQATGEACICSRASRVTRGEMIDPSLGCLSGAGKPVLQSDYSSDYLAEKRMRSRIFSRTSGSFCATSRIESYSSTERP
jgi:hypothetical protein